MTRRGSCLDVVAIDGPSGSGKSTAARLLAARIGWRHLDTGAMYRAVTLALLEAGIAFEEGGDLERFLADFDLVLDGSGRVLAGGRDVTAALRTPGVEARVSAVSALPSVRRRMTALQRAEATRSPLVAEGRDMTTVVFPDALLRVYLDASPEERARRRLAEFEARGRRVDFETVLAEIRARDFLDSTRADAPLRRAPDACYLDSTGLSIEEVVERLQALLEDARREAARGGDG